MLSRSAILAECLLKNTTPKVIEFVETNYLLFVIEILEEKKGGHLESVGDGTGE